MDSRLPTNQITTVLMLTVLEYIYLTCLYFISQLMHINMSGQITVVSMLTLLGYTFNICLSFHPVQQLMHINLTILDYGFAYELGSR